MKNYKKKDIKKSDNKEQEVDAKKKKIKYKNKLEDRMIKKDE